MTQRKPPGQSWESWIEQQIREAQEQGEFDHLEGAGKPLRGLEGAHDPLWWVKGLMQRERLSLLPDALQIKVTVERAVEQLWQLSDEKHVRATLATLNADIAKVNRTSISDPPTSLALLDVEAIVERWRARRQQP